MADYYEIGAFMLVTEAAITGVLTRLAFPGGYHDADIAPACLWSAAYAIYPVRY